MAEWLRRLTRNQMGSSRVGSNPTHSDFLKNFVINECRYFSHAIVIVMLTIFFPPGPP